MRRQRRPHLPRLWGRGRGLLVSQQSNVPLTTVSGASGAEDGNGGTGNPVATTSSSSQIVITAVDQSSPTPVLAAIPNNFKLESGRSYRFSIELNVFCARWAARYVPSHGIRPVMDLLVDKIFRDNEGRYNLFLLEATICTTSTLGNVWVGPSNRNISRGLRFRHMFQMGGNPFVIFIFDQSPTLPMIEFTLEYMHPKYQREQLVPDIVAKSSNTGRLEVANNNVLVRSTRGQGDFSYPKNYLFHHDHELFQRGMSWLNDEN